MSSSLVIDGAAGNKGGPKEVERVGEARPNKAFRTSRI